MTIKDINNKFLYIGCIFVVSFSFFNSRMSNELGFFLLGTSLGWISLSFLLRQVMNKQESRESKRRLNKMKSDMLAKFLKNN